MNILVINTVSEKSYISLICNDKLVTSVFSSYQKTSENLLLEIDKLLKKNSLKITDINAVSVCVGPGSFTGIRVALATVKAFNFALNTKIISFNLFDLIKHQGIKAVKANSGGAYIDDGKNSYFAGKDELVKLKNKTLLIFENEKDFFKDFKFKEFDIVNNSIILSKEYFIKSNFTEIKNLIPVYLLKSQAERELEEKIKNSKVKRLSKQHLNFVTDIENKTFTHNVYSADLIERELSSKTKKYFGLFLGDSVIGYVSYSLTESDAELEKIAISPKYQSLGLGYKLLKESLNSLKIEKCFLEVNKNNTKAINLYIKLGFVKMGERKNYYEDGATALTMQKVF